MIQSIKSRKKASLAKPWKKRLEETAEYNIHYVQNIKLCSPIANGKTERTCWQQYENGMKNQGETSASTEKWSAVYKIQER